MITNYLIDLLKDNECVIVPGMGAFISKRHSATIDYANHRFEPPYKEIVFNNKLTNNDELLVDFIAEKESISKEDSLAKIQDFVNQSLAILDVNMELELKGLGKLRKFGSDFVFDTDKNVNLLGDAFGLSAFNIQPVFRTETYQVIKEQIFVEQKAKNTEYTIAIESVEDKPETEVRRKPSLFRTLTYTTLAFLLIFVINWSTDKTGSNLASWNPFLYSSPNEYFLSVLEEIEGAKELEGLKEEKGIEDLEGVAVECIDVIGSEILEIDNSEVVVSENLETTETENIKEETSQVLEENSETHRLIDLESHYYIIGGSFQTEASAEKCVNILKRQGFENAASLEMNDKGNIRVYYESFAKKPEALERLDIIKKEFNESAWLLYQK